MMSEEALMELIRATREDVSHIRDNHLAHIKDDIMNPLFYGVQRFFA